MFGSDTLDLMLGAAESFIIEDFEAKIADHQRSIDRLRKQKNMFAKIFASYKAAQVKADKKMKEFQKKQKVAMRKAPKFPPYPIGGVVTQIAGRKAG
jgi:hypothetical protein